MWVCKHVHGGVSQVLLIILGFLRTLKSTKHGELPSFCLVKMKTTQRETNVYMKTNPQQLKQSNTANMFLAQNFEVSLNQNHILKIILHYPPAEKA